MGTIVAYGSQGIGIMLLGAIGLVISALGAYRDWRVDRARR